jgi:hypothetical protein
MRSRPRTRPRAPSARAGFTIIEAMIGLAVLALVMVNVSTIVRSTSDVYESGSILSLLEDQADETMDRLCYAVISTRAEDLLIPLPPLSSSSIDYECMLGVEDGAAVWGDPSRIELVIDGGQVVWMENPGTSKERRVVWTRFVPEFLEDELPNGVDDNGNELFDEAGLTFGMEDGQVVICLTLRRRDEGQIVYTRTFERRVTCRN